MAGLLLLSLLPARADNLVISVGGLTNSVNAWSPASTQTFTVAIAGGATTRLYWVESDQPWATVSPVTGTSTGEADTIAVSFTAANLAPGTNDTDIMVVAPSASNSPQFVHVELIVGPYPTNSCAVRPGAGSAGVPCHSISVPVELVALGNEHALGFSLTYDKASFSTPQIDLGPAAIGGTLVTNTSQASNGRIGILIQQPLGTTFSAGVCTVAVVSLQIATRTGPGAFRFGFTNSPIVCQVSDTNAAALTTAWCAGNVRVFGGYEGNTIPRTTGTLAAAVTLADWVQVGRFSSGIDTPATPAEYQRADCAPRGTLGDGVMSVLDWVQASRYFNGDDPVVEAGGPVSNLSVWVIVPPSSAPARDVLPDPPAGTPARTLSLLTPAEVLQGQANVFQVVLDAHGNENALSFSVSFDPSVFTYSSAQLGAGAAGALLVARTAQAANGDVGFGLALPPGQVFAAGQHSVLNIALVARPGYEAITSEVALAAAPVDRKVVSDAAAYLSSAYASPPAFVLVPQADTLDPVLTVLSPSTECVTYTMDDAVALNGSASDNWRVENVSWQNSSGGAGPCAGTTEWTAPAVPLASGTNVITVAARDPANRVSAAQVTVVHAMSRSEGEQDSDGDGFSNWEEFLAGTDAHASGSQLELLQVVREGGAVEIQWASVPDRTYGIYRAEGPGAPFVRIGSRLATGSTEAYIDAAPAGGARLYRVVVE